MDHAGNCEVGLLRKRQFERLTFVSDAAWAKRVDALFKNTLSIFRSASPQPQHQLGTFKLRHLGPSGLVRALNATTQRLDVASLSRSSRATVATA